MPDRSRPVGTPFSRHKSSRRVRGEVLLDDRTKRRLSRIRWRRIGLGLMLTAFAAGAITLYVSPVARVHNVEVTGANGLSTAEIEDLAGLEGESLLTMNGQAAAERIRALPMVKDVAITRSWPQTVRISIVERTAWAVWQVGAASYVVDDTGVILPLQAPPEGLPTIVVAGAEGGLEPGDIVDPDAVALTRLLREQVPAQLALNVGTFEWSAQSGLTLTTDAGYRVVLGDSQNMEYKLAVWRQVEGQLGRESMSGHVLDLRFGDRPSFQ
ncbi:MAG TPA: FtsQ-type POTRA domain-containing protein [Dehalococcoidia bacterium]|nr:FtsQ-type POTRA domain-containing protein [Dehalococcoidia bacterium]